jgi:hypothetical protein
MDTAKFFQEITVIDPDSYLPVEVDLFKHENGGIFGIDASYLDQNFDSDEDIKIPDPLSNGSGIYGKMVKLTGI